MFTTEQLANVVNIIYRYVHTNGMKQEDKSEYIKIKYAKKQHDYSSLLLSSGLSAAKWKAWLPLLIK
jgi:hypothetical protein